MTEETTHIIRYSNRLSELREEITKQELILEDLLGREYMYANLLESELKSVKQREDKS